MRLSDNPTSTSTDVDDTVLSLPVAVRPHVRMINPPDDWPEEVRGVLLGTEVRVLSAEGMRKHAYWTLKTDGKDGYLAPFGDLRAVLRDKLPGVTDLTFLERHGPYVYIQTTSVESGEGF